jgi:hypothetical protein
LRHRIRAELEKDGLREVANEEILSPAAERRAVDMLVTKLAPLCVKRTSKRGKFSSPIRIRRASSMRWGLTPPAPCRRLSTGAKGQGEVSAVGGRSRQRLPRNARGADLARQPGQRIS